ncbi:hypothetical protein [Xanthomarina gelatinilytica]|jgi:hypothetical protein|uniref:hypothetical protein n=1 Tax=Xanthomarina gelatinilytica TaxID=1137281 RepID=UPI003AA8C3E9
MKKINKMLFLVALSVGIFTTSCSEDDYTGASMINYSSPTVTLSTASTNVVVDESAIPEDGEFLIPVTASISEPVLADIHIPLVQTGGTADAHDFDLGTMIITSGTTSATTNIVIYNTCDTGVEGNETLTVSFADNIANAKMTPFSMDISIENDWVNDVIEFEFDWSGELTYTAGVPAEVTIDFCDADIDFALADNGGNVLGYIAATASCPEAGGFSGLPDGTYFILAEVYDNPFSGLGLTDTMPITTTYSQCGFDTAGSFVNSVLNTATISGDVIPLATVEISGGYNYTVTPW